MRRPFRTLAEPVLCLAIGGILTVFANGRWIVPLAAWLAPVFMLRFVRTQRLLPGLLGSLLVSILAYVIAWRGLIPLPGVFYYLVAGGLALVFWLAYLADRLLTSRTRGFPGTLVFPLAWTSLEYLCTAASPYASWGSLAYTQYGNLPLVQLVSVTGIWGLTFLITWFASVFNWTWQTGFAWSRIRRGAALYLGVLAAVLLFGGFRLAVFSPQEDTVRIHSVVSAPQANGLPDSLLLEDYLERTRAQAQAGADIVLWDEGAVSVSQKNESRFVDRGRELAREEGIYLLMALCVVRADDPRGGAFNKAVWIDPAGEVAFEHIKHLLLPGGSFIAGDGRLRTDDTPYGRITAAICMDLDLPSAIRQAGRARADILLDPSFDWKEIDPLHTRMASFRAVENGFSLVRATCEGLSAGFDHHGRIVSATDYFASHAAPLVCYVPTHGVRTAYSVVGDSFAWLCIVGFVGMVGRAVFAPRRGGHGTPP